MTTKQTNAQATAKEEAIEQEFFAKQAETPTSPEAQNVYSYATSSTTEATMSSGDFWKIKLVN
jgi:hypothetical protein